MWRASIGGGERTVSGDEISCNGMGWDGLDRYERLWWVGWAGMGMALIIGILGDDGGDEVMMKSIIDIHDP